MRSWPLWRRRSGLFAGLLLQFFAVFLCVDIYAQTLTSVQKSLKTAFPEATAVKEDRKILSADEKLKIAEEAQVSLHPFFDRYFPFYVASKDGVVTGYAIENAIEGKWGPIHYLLILDAAGRIRDLVVLDYRERRGQPVAKKRFRKQFFGKSVEDPLRLQRDIQGITGASISSRGLTDGVRKLLYVFKLFYPAAH